MAFRSGMADQSTVLLRSQSVLIRVSETELVIFVDVETCYSDRRCTDAVTDRYSSRHSNVNCWHQAYEASTSDVYRISLEYAR